MEHRLGAALRSGSSVLTAVVSDNTALHTAIQVAEGHQLTAGASQSILSHYFCAGIVFTPPNHVLPFDTENLEYSRSSSSEHPSILSPAEWCRARYQWKSSQCIQDPILRNIYSEVNCVIRTTQDFFLVFTSEVCVISTTQEVFFSLTSEVCVISTTKEFFLVFTCM